jgi:hypothetical protein
MKFLQSEDEKRLNNLIETIEDHELKVVLMFVTTISQDNKLSKLIKRLKKVPKYSYCI